MLVAAIVDEPDKAKVKFTQADQMTVYEIDVAKPDRARVIGKQGRMINCIKHFLSSVCAKNRIKAILEICE